MGLILINRYLFDITSDMDCEGCIEKRSRKILSDSGQSLILALFFLAIIMMLVAIFVRCVGYGCNFTESSLDRTSARYMAESGIEYSLYQLRYGDWLSKEKPFIFKSPEIGDIGSFDLEVDESSFGSQILIRSTGIDSYSNSKTTVTVTVGNPYAITGYLLSVLNYNSEINMYEPSCTVFGSDGVAAVGLSQEMIVIPLYRSLSVKARSDVFFGGIAPGTDYVIDDSGLSITRTGNIPPHPGSYNIDYANGIITFSEADAGRHVSVFYDYLRRVSMTSPCGISLPYESIREGSDMVFGMKRVPVYPTEKGCYMPLYDRGALAFSETNKGALLNVKYSFLGTRMAGPVRVNGDVEWRNTNLLYLFSSKNQKFCASGRVLLGSRGRLIVHCEDDGFGGKSSDFKDRVLEHVPTVSPPSVNFSRLRSQSKSKNGSVVYVDNYGDCEFKDIVSNKMNISDEIVGNSGVYIDWNKYNDELYHDWEVMGSERWKGGVYSPPGKVINLSSFTSSSGRGDRGLVFLEGNAIIRGSLPEGQRLTIVSARNIYIEESIGGSKSASLTLIADGNICLNVTRMQPRLTGGGPLSFYINCVAYARRGAIAVIPGGGSNNRLIMHGAFSMNHIFPNEEWAKSFDSIDWVYDPSFCGPKKLPVELIGIESWN